jgi:hypothetical protein
MVDNTDSNDDSTDAENTEDLGNFEEETGITPPGEDEEGEQEVEGSPSTVEEPTTTEEKYDDAPGDDDVPHTFEDAEDDEDNYDETRLNVNKSADSIRVTWKCKRGTGTRDQDEFDVKVRGDDAEEVNEQLSAVQERVAEMMDIAREIQPDEEDE